MLVGEVMVLVEWSCEIQLMNYAGPIIGGVVLFVLAEGLMSGRKR